jgi:hypothetical protein
MDGFALVVTGGRLLRAIKGGKLETAPSAATVGGRVYAVPHF